MKLEVGKTYKTRSGKNVNIISQDDSKYPFGGIFLGSNCHDDWLTDGSYNILVPDNASDLVSEVVKFIDVDKLTIEEARILYGQLQKMFDQC